MSIKSFTKIENCNKPVERACGGKPLEGVILKQRKEDLLKFAKRFLRCGLYALIPQVEIQVGSVVYKTLTEKTVIVSRCLDKSIENVVVPEAIVANGVVYSVIGVGSKAFCNCNLLNFLVLPSVIRSIGRHAFKGCPLCSLVFYGEVQPKIGKSSFDMKLCTDTGRDIYLPNMRHYGIQKDYWGGAGSNIRTHYSQGVDMYPQEKNLKTA